MKKKSKLRKGGDVVQMEGVEDEDRTADPVRSLVLKEQQQFIKCEGILVAALFQNISKSMVMMLQFE